MSPIPLQGCEHPSNKGGRRLFVARSVFDFITALVLKKKRLVQPNPRGPDSSPLLNLVSTNRKRDHESTPLSELASDAGRAAMPLNHCASVGKSSHYGPRQALCLPRAKKTLAQVASRIGQRQLIVQGLLHGLKSSQNRHPHSEPGRRISVRKTQTLAWRHIGSRGVFIRSDGGKGAIRGRAELPTLLTPAASDPHRHGTAIGLTKTLSPSRRERQDRRCSPRPAWIRRASKPVTAESINPHRRPSDYLSPL